jgi:Bacterial Ig-like domain (group 2)
MKRANSLLLLAVVSLLAGCKSGTAGRVISVSVSPTNVDVVVGTTQQMTATVMQTFNTAVTWSVVGGSANGTISSTGLYTAPATVPAPAQVTITATSQKDTTKSGSATLTITTTAGPSNITVMVSPAVASVANFATQQFTAMVAGTNNAGVTWQVNGTTGGSQTVGFISAAGFYVAPGNVPTIANGAGDVTTTTVTVKAVSQADPTASGSSMVTIVPGNQSKQSAGTIELGTSGGNGNDSISNATNHTVTCCGGTLGSLVTRGGQQYILSNNHVLARSDTAVIGDPIVQPGLIDAQCDKNQATTVATLTQFVNLESEDKAASSSNIDAAIAQVVGGQIDPSGKILYLGASADSNGVPLAGAPNAGSGIVASVGMPVAKSGRSTGLTCSTVLAVNTNTSVDYNKSCDGTGTKFTVLYDNQVDIGGGGFGAEGDSGSLIVSQSTADPVGLLYAGSDTDTVANPVAPVLNFFASGGNSVTFVGGAAHSVIGCTLPTAPQSAAKTVPAASLAAELLQKAEAARDAQSPALMAHPDVQAVGVGASLDNPAEPAIVFFVTKGQPHTGIPAQVGGIRTRIVEGDLWAHRGAISAQDTAANEQIATAPQLVYPLSAVEMQRAKVVHAAHAKDLMGQPGVQGVGITSSVDSPGEAALMIFVIRGVAHPQIPAVIDGLRTRVRESSRFRAGYSGLESRRACALPAKSRTR